MDTPYAESAPSGSAVVSALVFWMSVVMVSLPAGGVNVMGQRVTAAMLAFAAATTASAVRPNSA